MPLEIASIGLAGLALIVVSLGLFRASGTRPVTPDDGTSPLLRGHGLPEQAVQQVEGRDMVFVQVKGGFRQSTRR